MWYYILWGALALLVFGLVFTISASITVVLFDFLTLSALPAIGIAFEQLTDFFIYDVRARFYPDYVKKVLVQRLGSSYETFMVIRRYSLNMSPDILKMFMKTFYTTEKVGKGCVAGKKADKGKQAGQDPEFMTNALRIWNIPRRVKADMLFEEIGYCSDYLLIQLEPFWKDIIKESLLSHSLFCPFVY